MATVYHIISGQLLKLSVRDSYALIINIICIKM